MPGPAGGTGGTVTSYTNSDTAGRSATVHYPASGTEGAHDETYTDLTADEMAAFRDAFKVPDAKVDVSVDANGSVTGVTVKR
jgi:hypothetical protein